MNQSRPIPLLAVAVMLLLSVSGFANVGFEKAPCTPSSRRRRRERPLAVRLAAHWGLHHILMASRHNYGKYRNCQEAGV